MELHNYRPYVDGRVKKYGGMAVGTALTGLVAYLALGRFNTLRRFNELPRRLGTGGAALATLIVLAKWIKLFPTGEYVEKSSKLLPASLLTQVKSIQVDFDGKIDAPLPESLFVLRKKIIWNGPPEALNVVWAESAKTLVPHLKVIGQVEQDQVQNLLDNRPVILEIDLIGAYKANLSEFLSPDQLKNVDSIEITYDQAENVDLKAILALGKPIIWIGSNPELLSGAWSSDVNVPSVKIVGDVQQEQVQNILANLPDQAFISLTGPYKANSSELVPADLLQKVDSIEIEWDGNVDEGKLKEILKLEKPLEWTGDGKKLDAAWSAAAQVTDLSISDDNPNNQFSCILDHPPKGELHLSVPDLNVRSLGHSNLTQLSLDVKKLTRWQDLEKFPKLERLELSLDSAEDFQVHRALAELKHLREVTLKGPFVWFFPESFKCEKLTVDTDSFKDVNLTSLLGQRWSDLRELTIRSSNIDKGDFRSLGALEALDIRGTKIVKDVQFPQSLQKLVVSSKFEGEAPEGVEVILKA